MIILHHFAVHNKVETTQYNHIVLDLLSIGGKLGVNVFILITGYFMINSSFKIKKIIWLFVEISFYSITILLIFYGFGLSEFNTKLTLMSLFPLIYNLYWFGTVYVMLYIISPFINIFINKINRFQHRNLIILLTAFWSIIPTFTAGDLYFSYLGWFINLYIIGAYIKFYEKKDFNFKKDIITFLLAYLIIILSVVILNMLGETYSILLNFTTYFSKINSFILLLCTISLFQIFNHLKIPNTKIINNIAKSIFSVYLIHDNIFIRVFLWEQLFTFDPNISQLGLFLYGLFTSLVVLIFCIIINKFLSVVINFIYKFLLSVIESKKYKKFLDKMIISINKI